MTKPAFQRSRPPIESTSASEAAVAAKGADTPAAQQPAPETPVKAAKAVRKPFGVPLTSEENAQLDRCGELADKTKRNMSTRLLKWAMDMYEADPDSMPRQYLKRDI